MLRHAGTQKIVSVSGVPLSSNSSQNVLPKKWEDIWEDVWEDIWEEWEDTLEDWEDTLDFLFVVLTC